MPAWGERYLAKLNSPGRVASGGGVDRRDAVVKPPGRDSGRPPPDATRPGELSSARYRSPQAGMDDLSQGGDGLGIVGEGFHQGGVAGIQERHATADQGSGIDQEAC